MNFEIMVTVTEIEENSRGLWYFEEPHSEEKLRYSA